MTHIKTDKYGSNNKFDTIFLLDHKSHLEGSRCHFLSPRPTEHVENMVVSALCMLNNKKCHRFDEEICCVPIDIVNSMLAKHNPKYTDPDTMKVFEISEFKDYLHFLDKKTSNSFISVCTNLLWRPLVVVDC
ncbi:uncharacterized protein [Arachis hypogaea]|uniref:uncharacterized protein n=1 Tax=Arachis hypogaea TaxID=3818 RepID=UPI003B22154F|nr:uncharacterized protein DS421_16g542800 [Arachis hypogaea]